MKLKDLLSLLTDNMIVCVTTRTNVYGVPVEVTLFKYYGRYDKVDSDQSWLTAMEQDIKNIYDMEDTTLYVEI